MRAEAGKENTLDVSAQTPWLMAIGQQLRENFEPARSIPKDLAARIEQLEAGQVQPERAAVRLAIINAVIRASVARRAPSFSCAGDDCTPSRQATELGKFEKLVLDLFDNHLSEPERESAVRNFVAYIRICHALLDLGLIKEGELTP